ncbi:MAG TPA: hypothetical protein VNA89_16315, partial [Gemmatimonadaceae bacterium]|nr:hypothetical protein [Gemmatimonadaceae bacterium]
MSDGETARRTGNYPGGRRRAAGGRAALVLTNYAASALDQRDGRLAKELSERAVEAACRLDDLEVLAVARKNLAEALLLLGESLDRAEDLASATLGYFVAGPNRSRVVKCYTLLGNLNECRGETGHALPLAKGTRDRR